MYLINSINIKKIYRNNKNAIVIATMALLFLTSYILSNIENKKLIIYNNNSDEKLIVFPIKKNWHFSVEYTHSVNMSPVIDYYNFNTNNEIYVYKTIYYNYGAGVETELENDEIMTYGHDGSMIINNINKKISPLTYYLSSFYDHKLKINDGDEISLWEKCGKNLIIRIEIK